MDYIKVIYTRKFQAEIESYKDTEYGNLRDAIQSQDILLLDTISI